MAMTRRQYIRESPLPDFTFPDPKGEGRWGPPAPCSPSVRAGGEASVAPFLLTVGRLSQKEP